MKKSYLFPSTTLTPQPKGSIQFSSPYKPRQLTPKANLMTSQGKDPTLQATRSRGLTFNPTPSMTQSSIFLNAPHCEESKSNSIQQRLEFQVKDRVFSGRKQGNLSNLAKYATPSYASPEHPYERKVSNPYTIKVLSETHIPLEHEKLSFNPQLRRPFERTKLNFSPIRVRAKQQHSVQDFQVGKKLGKGNFGEVFLARHKVLGCVFALKIVAKKVIREKKMERQLLWEATIQMTLNHPNIVGLYGMFDDAENIYLVQELMTDGHLFTQMKYIKTYPEAEAANIIKEVCSGVEYMHRKEVIHRDIKPENILIQMGIHKICDFGWAVYAPNSLRSTLCGTPLYMSPQLIKGESYSQAVDNWALGILSYQLLIGRSPFKINTEQELNKIITEEVKFPEYIEVSEKAKEFIGLLLTKDPAHRTDLDAVMEHPFLRQVGKDSFVDEEWW